MIRPYIPVLALLTAPLLAQNAPSSFSTVRAQAAFVSTRDMTITVMASNPQKLESQSLLRSGFYCQAYLSADHKTYYGYQVTIVPVANEHKVNLTFSPIADTKSSSGPCMPPAPAVAASSYRNEAFSGTINENVARDKAYRLNELFSQAVYAAPLKLPDSIQVADDSVIPVEVVRSSTLLPGISEYVKVTPVR